jgi:hypothetical protein
MTIRPHLIALWGCEILPNLPGWEPNATSNLSSHLGIPVERRINLASLLMIICAICREASFSHGDAAKWWWNNWLKHDLKDRVKF